MSERAVGVVLTGGRSTRMGVDKATLVVDGKPLAVRVADALWESGCHPVECQGGDPEVLAEYGLDGVQDDPPDGGPVIGILQALRRHPDVRVAVAACDFPDLDGSTVAGLLDVARSPDTAADVVVASAGGQRQLVSVWASGTADRLASLVEAGERSYLAVLDALSTVDVEVGADVVRNVNTPSDVRARDNLGPV